LLGCYLLAGILRFDFKQRGRSFGIKQDESVVDICHWSTNPKTEVKEECHPPGRFAFDRLSLTVANGDHVTFWVRDDQSQKPHRVQLTARFPGSPWFFSLLAFGSLLCGLVFLILNYRYPAQPENNGHAAGWIVLMAVLPLLVAAPLWRFSLSLLGDLPLWAVLLLGVPPCLAAGILSPRLGVGISRESPALRNVLVAVGILLPLPFQIAIHQAHKETVASADLITDIGLDYLESLGIVLVLLGMFVALRWFFRAKSGYTMLPFLNAAGKKYEGRAVAQELAAELHKIDTAHEDLKQLRRRVLGDWDAGSGAVVTSKGRGGPGNKRKQASLIGAVATAGTEPRAALGDIVGYKVGDLSFSLGQFFSDLKTFWSATDPKGTFSGSIRRDCGKLRVCVSFREHGRTLEWSGAPEIDPESADELGEILRGLALDIYVDIEEEASCSRREALSHYTEAIHDLKDHFDAQDPLNKSRALQNASGSFRRAYAAEAHGKKVSPSVAMLLAHAYLDRRQLREAEDLAGVASQLAQYDDTESQAATRWLRGLVEHTGSKTEAERSYKAALQADPKFEPALSGLAILLWSQKRTDDLVRVLHQLAHCRHERYMKEGFRERRSKAARWTNRGLRREVILGDLLWDFNRYDEAIKEFRAAAKRTPKDVWAEIRLATTLARNSRHQKEKDEALEKLNRLKENLENKRAKLQRSCEPVEGLRRHFRRWVADEPRRYWQLNDTEVALFNICLDLAEVYEALPEKEYEPASELARDSLWASYMRGLLYYRQRKRTEAIAQFERVTELADDRADAHLRLGKLYAAEGRDKEAAREISRVAELDPFGNSNQRIAQLKAILKSAPHWVRAYLAAEVRFARRETAKAIGKIHQTIRLAPTLPDPYLLLGQIYELQDELDKAIDVYKRASDLDPSDARPHLGLGYIYRLQDELDKAIDVYKRASDLDPSDARPHLGLGYVYRLQGELDKAIEAYKRANDLDPSDARPHCDLGYVYRTAGRLEEGLEEFKIAQRLDPEGYYAFRGAGGVRRQMGQYAEAVEDYTKAIQLNSQDAYSQIALSVCYDALNRSELAAGHKYKALELGESQVEGQYNRARFWALAGDRNRALARLREAIKSGDTSKKQMENDIDLNSLRADPDFKAIIAEFPGELKSAEAGETG
jgi:tetratricopeptide (TPR) repeat protein